MNYYNSSTIDKTITGSFISANDGIHNVVGTAKIIHLEDGRTIIRLENFNSTN
jgi:hypothetical protein